MNCAPVSKTNTKMICRTNCVTPTKETPITDPPVLSEEYYGSLTEGLRLNWDFVDPDGPSIAGEVTLEAETDEQKGIYYIYFGDEQGILPGYTWVTYVKLTKGGEKVVVFHPGFESVVLLLDQLLCTGRILMNQFLTSLMLFWNTITLLIMYI